MYMAGRAGALAAAIAVNTRHTVVDCGVPRGCAALDRNRIFDAVRFDENDCGHFFSCQSCRVKSRLGRFRDEPRAPLRRELMRRTGPGANARTADRKSTRLNSSH